MDTSKDDENNETKICCICKATKNKKCYSKTQWKKSESKCSSCVDKAQIQLGKVKDNSDTSIESESDDEDVIALTHLYAHDNNNWHCCIIHQEIDKIDVKIIQLVGLPDPDKFISVNPGILYRLRIFDHKLINQPHKIDLQQLSSNNDESPIDAQNNVERSSSYNQDDGKQNVIESTTYINQKRFVLQTEHKMMKFKTDLNIVKMILILIGCRKILMLLLSSQINMLR